MTAEVGNNLKVWRAKFDITQSELADLAEVSRKTINTLERTVYTPSVGLAMKIACIFGTTVEEVFFLKRTTLRPLPRLTEKNTGKISS